MTVCKLYFPGHTASEHLVCREGGGYRWSKRTQNPVFPIEMCSPGIRKPLVVCDVGYDGS